MDTDREDPPIGDIVASVIDRRAELNVGQILRVFWSLKVRSLSVILVLIGIGYGACNWHGPEGRKPAQSANLNQSDSSDQQHPANVAAELASALASAQAAATRSALDARIAAEASKECERILQALAKQLVWMPSSQRCEPPGHRGSDINIGTPLREGAIRLVAGGGLFGLPIIDDSRTLDRVPIDLF